MADTPDKRASAQKHSEYALHDHVTPTSRPMERAWCAAGAGFRCAGGNRGSGEQGGGVELKPALAGEKDGRAQKATILGMRQGSGWTSTAFAKRKMEAFSA